MQRSSEEKNRRYLRTNNMLNTIHTRATATFVISFVLSVCVAMPVLGQDSPEQQSVGNGHAAGQAADSSAVAYVGNTPIRQDEVDRYAGREVNELTKRLYLLRSQALNSMIDAIVVRNEAERQNMDVAQLLQKKVEAPPRPSNDEIEREWTNNYDSLKGLGEVGGHYQVVLNIESHQRAEELRKYLDHLREANHVSMLLEPPVFELQGRPGANNIGNLAGARELVVFQDYECPFCRQLEPELESALQKDAALADLKVTIKQFPLPQHKGAFDAAVAVECASEQNQFRSMHELLVANQDHSSDGLDKTASQAGLNLTKFHECTTGDAARAQIRLDMEEARKNGVEGTPTLFLEGQQIDLPNNPQELSRVLGARMALHQKTSASTVLPASSTR